MKHLIAWSHFRHQICSGLTTSLAKLQSMRRRQFGQWLVLLAMHTDALWSRRKTTYARILSFKIRLSRHPSREYLWFQDPSKVPIKTFISNYFFSFSVWKQCYSGWQTEFSMFCLLLLCKLFFNICQLFSYM